MVKTRSTRSGVSGAGGCGPTNSNRRLHVKTTKQATTTTSSTNTSIKLDDDDDALFHQQARTVSRGSQTTSDHHLASPSSSSSTVSLSELRRDLVGISAPPTSMLSSMRRRMRSSSENDLRVFISPKRKCAGFHSAASANATGCSSSSAAFSTSEPSTSKGLRRRQMLQHQPTVKCDTDTLRLSRIDTGRPLRQLQQHNVRHFGSKRKVGSIGKAGSSGEPSKKRRKFRSPDEPSTSSASDYDDEDDEELLEDVEVLEGEEDDLWTDLEDEDEEEEEAVETLLMMQQEENAVEEFDEDNPPGDRVAYIHVGEGGEADLEAQLKGAENLDIQILEEENLPDIDETDMIHGLDHTGTARDYVDERHRCTINCPVGCQGHLRPNEIVIYESFKWKGKLRGRRR